MGSLWLHSLPDVLRAAGLDVETWPGWEWRSRSTGGYDAVWGIGVHHDAIRTGVSLEARCRAAWDSTGNPDRPVGAIWLHDDGRVMVGAAGATNTQGRGGPYRTSRGVIPVDAGNRYMLSVEASNDGVGTPWPVVQQDAYVTLCAALCDWLALDPLRDVIAHFEWSPGRKIDPAGQSRYATGRASWRMPQFRADINVFEEDDMRPSQIVIDTRLNGTFACVGGRWVPWLAPAPPGVPVWTGDHPWTREQILADQGEAAAGLWRERMQATK